MDTTSHKTPLLERPGFNKLLIFTAAATWGLSFVVMKDLVDKLPVFYLLTVRYTLATLVMVWASRRKLASALRSTRTIKLGLLMGVLNFAAYAVQTMGLSLTTPGKNSFFTGCYCVMVPFAVWAIVHIRPTARHVLAGVICVAGIGLIAADGEVGLNAGDLLTLAGAVFYAIQFACLNRWGSGADSVVVTTLEFIVMTVASVAITLVFERGYVPTMPTLADVGALAFLVLVCSCFDFWAFNHGMMRVDPAEGSILSALESPFGVAASAMLYGERVTLRLLLGFTLIFVAIVVSEAGGELLRRIKGNTLDVA